ncbi:5-formyltetrahydrofolate cyclo-ligase [Streptomyces physcomitrii]|uniref:5-formyltetrahydrofolate cyclo-ligase n=1 Tax=Streptomyces physcomitrii TaxID=2724184 RepID=UPI0033C1E8C1
MNAAPRGTDSGKRMLRREFLSVRNRLTEDDVQEKAAQFAARAADLPALCQVSTVAAYVSMGTEPGTGALLDWLRGRGTRVLLPVLLADNDLSWGEYTGPGSLATVRHPGRMALREPAGPPLGTGAVLAADTVLLPGLAVDHAGIRLGRGGGSYDRVLARLARAGADPALVVLVYEGEVVEALPHEPHDRPVHAALTPAAVHRFGT